MYHMANIYSEPLVAHYAHPDCEHSRSEWDCYATATGSTNE